MNEKGREEPEARGVVKSREERILNCFKCSRGRLRGYHWTTGFFRQERSCREMIEQQTRNKSRNIYYVKKRIKLGS